MLTVPLPIIEIAPAFATAVPLLEVVTLPMEMSPVEVWPALASMVILLLIVFKLTKPRLTEPPLKLTPVIE